jgi:hypothetical protein
MQRSENKRRARRLARTLPEKTEPVDVRIIDCLANLRHLCDAHNLDYAELDRIAYNHYTAEIHPPGETGLGSTG